MIEVRNLTKRYGSHVAVNDVSFKVNEGEILGFLGPNGAGKTTTMNIITGFISATSGSAEINGYDILDKPEKAKENIGYLPDLPPLYGDMLVDEYLSFVCDIKKVKTSSRKSMISDIKNTVKIEDMGKRLCKNLSKGYKQRVGLAQAMIGFPRVLILDEPTNGLDPKQIIEMRDVIKKLGKKHTIILSSHILSEVSAVCDRVMIINRGTIVVSDTPENLSSSLSHGHKMAMRLKGTREQIFNAFSSVNMFKTVQPVSSREPGTFDFEIQGEDGIDIREAIYNTSVKNNLPLLMLTNADLSLEEIFLQVTTGEGGNN